MAKNVKDNGRRVDEPTGTEFVGHEWDGIEELNTPLPRWWLWLFYITVVWAAIYTIAYPAWPMISQATQGYFGWTSRGQLAQDMKDAEAARAGVRNRIAALDNLRCKGSRRSGSDFRNVRSGSSVYGNSSCFGRFAKS